MAKWSAIAAFWKWNLVKAAPSHQRWSRVAIVRSDALGDNILTLPLAGALCRLLPHVEVVWICRPYAQAVVAKSKAVHAIRVWEESKMDAKAEEALFDGVDAVVFAFPEPRLLAAAARAGVAVRATGRRWAAMGQSSHGARANARRSTKRRRACGCCMGLGCPRGGGFQSVKTGWACWPGMRQVTVAGDSRA